MFVEALARDLERTQRAIPSSCLFCVPQPRSLVADYIVTLDDVYTHFLTPAGADADAHAQCPGEYDTLNGKTVSIQGSHIVTGRGFDAPRKVRILLSEQLDIHRQRVTVLHLSRPLEGGIPVPEDPNEIDVATYRRFTAILRSFPEHELAFVDLDETIAQAQKLCARTELFHRYEQTLPALLRDEYDAAVDAIVQAGGFDSDSDDDDGSYQRSSAQSSHVLQIQQVVECYLMEQLHDAIFPRIVASCREQDATLADVLRRMQHWSPADFGIRPGFQCDVSDAIEVLVSVAHRKTPLDMLLAFKRCMDSVNDAITRNLRQHNLDLGQYQMATDDILDQLLYVLVQTYAHQIHSAAAAAVDPSSLGPKRSDGSLHDARPDSRGDDTTSDDSAGEVLDLPIVAVLQYISAYHFINSNTTALGFTLANFQVAIEFFLLRAAHVASCRACQQTDQQGAGDSGANAAESGDAAKCTQGIGLSRVEAAYARNVRDHEQFLARAVQDTDSAVRSCVTDRATEALAILGAWSCGEDADDCRGSDSEGESESHSVKHQDAENQAPSTTTVSLPAPSSPVRDDRRSVVDMSAGERFFAAVTSDGALFTWGDRSGGRLGYAAGAGDSRRVVSPQRVAALSRSHVLHVACGAFHALATDVNGHVFAWGTNSVGQLGFVAPALATPAPRVVGSPTLVADLCGTYVSAVACGAYHSLALSSAGHVFSWGCSRFGKLGRATASFADAVPTVVDATWTARSLELESVRSRAVAPPAGRADRAGLHGVVRRIAAGVDHSLAVTFDGAVFSWGRGDSGQLGHGSVMDCARPTQVMALAGASATDGFDVVDAAGGRAFSLFATATGAAFVSGRDPSAQRTAAPLLLPELLQAVPAQDEPTEAATAFPAARVKGVACGEAHFALLLASGAVLVSCSPSDVDNDASGDARQRSVVPVTSLGDVQRVVCGGSHTLVLQARADRQTA